MVDSDHLLSLIKFNDQNVNLRHQRCTFIVMMDTSNFYEKSWIYRACSIVNKSVSTSDNLENKYGVFRNHHLIHEISLSLSIIYVCE